MGDLLDASIQYNLKNILSSVLQRFLLRFNWHVSFINVVRLF